MRHILTLSIIVLTLAFPSASYATPVFSFSPIDAGSTATDALGINASGQIVGAVYDNYDCDETTGCYPTSPHGFLWESGTVTIIDVPGASETKAVAINNAGQIVGWFGDAGVTHGFLKDGDTFTTIDVPGADGTMALGINGTGQIVGSFWDATGNHGFLKDGDTFTTIDVPGASYYYIQVTGINDAGQIVGMVQSATATHGFLKDGDTFTTLTCPGAYDTAALGITSTGQIVGWFWVDGFHGFLKDGDTFTTFDVPGALNTFAYGINDAGRVVGAGMGSYPDLPQGFLAVPVAENAPPIASFTSVCSGLKCSFDGSGSADSDGTIASYAWNFGDGTTGSGATVNHTYAAGTYTITLIVTDSAGAMSSQSNSVTVVNTPPVASFTSACSGVTCTFNGSASADSDGTIASYAWDLGDGATSSGPIVSHIYATAGTYTITLTVTDNLGATGVQSTSVTVNQAFMHVGDLDRAITNQAGSTWSAIVAITVHDSSDSPVANATVSGSWSSGGTDSCTTNSIGQCAVSKSTIPEEHAGA